MNKKIVSTALAGLMAVSSMPINVFAVEPPSAPPDNSSTGGTSQAVLNQEATMFSATVPTALPISVDQDNKVVVATDAKVINGSSGPIVISNIQLLENHGWTLTKTPTKKVGKQEVDFNIKTANKIIPAAKETAIIYDAMVSPQKVAVTNAPVLDVIFTVDWDSYGSTVVSASKSTLLPDELSSLTVEGTTESDLFVWKNSNKAVAVLEPLPESHSVMSTFALLPEGQEELKASRKMGVRALAPGKTTVTVTDSSGNTITQEIVVIDNLLDRIYVHTQPTKKEYFEGEAFDPTGMQVNAVYMDSSEYPLTFYGYPKQPLVMGQNQVAISYDEKGVTKTTNVSIVVKAGDRDISLLPTTNGTFSTDKTKAKKGETVLVTANPSSGYALDKILVNGTEIVGNSFVMPAENVTVKATFKAIAYSVTQNPTANGSFIVSKPTAVIGDEVVITTTPAEGYVLNDIKVNGKVITGNKFTMTADNAAVEVTFKAVNYKITKMPTTNGSYTLNKETAIIGDQIIVVANPAAGYKLSSIKVDGVAISGTSFTMKAKDMTVEVEFAVAWTAAEATAYGYKFTQDATSTTITGLVNGATFTGDKIIPDSIDGKPVTSIGDWAFENCTGLTSIVIPSSVTSIGKGAFYSCTGLTSVAIPSSVTSIGSDTFRSCTGLTSITSNSPNYRVEEHRYLIQNSNNSLIAFAQKGVTSATIPSSVMSIGDWAFYDCTGLTSVTIPSSVTSIGNYAFHSCTGLTDITIPNSVTSIEDSIFSGCTGLTSVNIPSSVTSIGSDAFRSCTGLTSIVIPSSVTSIGNYAFYRCTGLTSVTIPSSVTSIANGTFQSCTGLTSVTIPSSVTSIHAWAFGNCSGLTSITIPSSVTGIGYGAFVDCTGLTSINIPSSVTSIGDYAFYNCTGLTSVNIAKPVNSIYGAPWQAPNTTVNWDYKG